MSFAPFPPPPPLVPAPCEVPRFDPVRVRGGRYRLGRFLRHRRRALAAGLVVTAAALVAAGPRDTDRARGHPTARPVPRHTTVELVSAPVRIADGATVRLLRPGDRVDVIAAARTPTGGGDARVVARGVRVVEVPKPPAGTPDDAVDGGGGGGGGGALIVVAVPRPTAVDLAGAGAGARLAVTLC
ncbi:hypothetical protein [Streptomyces griseoviridis]|uniref:hypothetical protein n=1 Tax=Streptomyces griseoviridis TaxID=45398 RepID=UPI003435F604